MCVVSSCIWIHGVSVQSMSMYVSRQWCTVVPVFKTTLRETTWLIRPWLNIPFAIFPMLINLLPKTTCLIRPSLAYTLGCLWYNREHCNDSIMWEAIKSYARIQTNLLVCAMVHLVNILLSRNMHVMHLCDM